MTPAACSAALAAALGALGLADVVALLAARRRRTPTRTARRWRLLARAGRLLGPRAPRSLEARLTAAGSGAAPGDVMAAKAGAPLARAGLAAAGAPPPPRP